MHNPRREPWGIYKYTHFAIFIEKSHISIRQYPYKRLHLLKSLQEKLIT